MNFSPVPDYFYIQSGVIPFRVQKGKIEILLITSRKKKRWIIPKGVVEPYMSPQESAAQEAYEEAGVFGRVLNEPAGSYQVKKWGGVCTVTVYPMLVDKEYSSWMESDIRKRKWMSIEKAVEKCGKKHIADIIRHFADTYSEKAAAIAE